MTRDPAKPVFVALVAFAFAIGCSSVSDSARILSKSVSSPSTSSSGESSPKQDDSYMRQVRDFSFGFARSGGDPAAFARGVGSLAQRHGINDWEKDANTCHAIGEGLHDAGIGATAAQTFVGKLVPADSKAAQWMREGYHGK